jgi:hypothetical protein
MWRRCADGDTRFHNKTKGSIPVDTAQSFSGRGFLCSDFEILFISHVYTFTAISSPRSADRCCDQLYLETVTRLEMKISFSRRSSEPAS